MKFIRIPRAPRRKRDKAQWHRRFAFWPKEIRHELNTWVWLEFFECRAVSWTTDLFGQKIYEWENRRIKR